MDSEGSILYEHEYLQPGFVIPLASLSMIIVMLGVCAQLTFAQSSYRNYSGFVVELTVVLFVMCISWRRCELIGKLDKPNRINGSRSSQ